MDKYDEDEPFECDKKYRYVKIVDRDQNRVIKAMEYLSFIPYAKKEFLGKDMDRIAQRYELVPAIDTPGKRKLRRK